MQARCLNALTSPTDRLEVTDVLRVEDLRRQVVADHTPLVHLPAQRLIEDRPYSPDVPADGVAGEDLGHWSERSSVLMPFGRILYRLARHLGGPVVEFGTGSGVSTAYISAGLERSGAGQVVTLDVNPTLTGRARLHLDEGRFANVVVQTGSQETIGVTLFGQFKPTMVHIDSDHRSGALADLLDTIQGGGARPFVVCLDDIRWSPGMEALWTDLTEGQHGTAYTLDFGLWGVALISRASGKGCRRTTLDPPKGLAPASVVVSRGSWDR